MVWEGIRQLTYKQHGGSGTNLTLTEVENMDLRRFLDWIDWLKDQREKEADAIRKAAKRG